MKTHDKLQNFDASSSDKFKHQITSIGNEVSTNAGTLTMEKDMVLEHIKAVTHKNNSLLTRWTLSPHQKQLARNVEEIQVKAFTDLAEQRNASLRTVGKIQYEVLKEIGNGILQTGRSSIQTAVKKIYMENFMSLMTKMEILNDQFCELIEQKMKKLGNAPASLQDMLLDQIQTLKSKWMNAMDSIYDDFNNILTEKV
jgi:hypothetical protein